jgi:pimeloyl-ACP methyl ester carboxylesterase
LSERPDATYDLAWYADCVGAWLEALGLEEVDLVGHSLGGGIAQWLLLKHRDKVRRLALVAPGGLGREVSLAIRLCSVPKVVELLGQPFMAVGTRVVMTLAGGVFGKHDIEHLAWMNSMPGSSRALARTVADIANLSGQTRHFSHRSHELETLPPVAIFWGDRDRVLPVKHMHTVGNYLERARVYCFEGSGHFPHHDRAEEFVHHLESYLDAPQVVEAQVRGVRRRGRGEDSAGNDAPPASVVRPVTSPGGVSIGGVSRSSPETPSSDADPVDGASESEQAAATG